MALKAEGIWPCLVLGATFGEDDKGVPQVQINVRIDDGPNKGQNCTYENRIDTRSAPYAARSCQAVGWQGRNLLTLHDDCEKWIAETGGKSTVEIRHLEIKNGKRAGELWDKVTAIGRGSRVLNQPSTSTLDDANEAMRAALAADTGDESDDRIPF